MFAFKVFNIGMIDPDIMLLLLPHYDLKFYKLVE